jgi:hypothetical protein
MLHNEAALEALGRLCQIAKRDTGQSRRVANFLFAWQNTEENGGWDPTDLWNVDTAIAEDMLAVLKLPKDSHRYRAIWGSNLKSGNLASMAQRAHTVDHNFDFPSDFTILTLELRAICNSDNCSACFNGLLVRSTIPK